MLWRLKFYKDRAVHLVTIIGAIASVLGVGIPGLLSEGSVVWWKLAVLSLSIPFTVVAIVLVFRSEHPTRVYRIGADTDITNYLYRWIQTGGHVVICTPRHELGRRIQKDGFAETQSYLEGTHDYLAQESRQKRLPRSRRCGGIRSW